MAVEVEEGKKRLKTQESDEEIMRLVVVTKYRSAATEAYCWFFRGFFFRDST